jgi:hypothetical protein
MANALIPVIEGEGTFDHVLAMLNFQESTVRKFFVDKTTNALVRQEWLAYEELSMTRKRDETYSSYGWLRKFCLSDTLRRIFSPSPCSFDFASFLKHAGIMLQSFPRFRPLDEDATQFLRSLSLYSLLAQAFHIPPAERPPLLIILDEAEHALSRDSGVIATILREGRGLNIHLILLFHEFAEVAAHNPGLLETVLNGCRTKFIGGHLTQSNLEVLTSELFTTEWHPHIVRDEIVSLEVEPVETTRVSYSRSRARSREYGCSFPYSETDGRSTSETTGTSTGTSVGLHVQRGVSRGQSRAHTTANGTAHTVMDGVADSEVYGESHMFGEGYTSGAMDAQSTGMSAVLGTGMTETWDPQNPAALFPNSMTTSLSEMAGTSSSGTHAESQGYHSLAADGESYAHGTARTHAEGISRSRVEADSVAESEALMHSLGAGVSHSEEQSHSTTTGQSNAISRGVTPSVSVGESFSESQTISPFHELRKRWRVASREFLSLQDFLTTKLIKVKSLATAHWVVQTPQGIIVFFRALWVKPLMGGKERLATFRANVRRKPWYPHDDTVQVGVLPALASMKDVTPEALRIPEVLTPLPADLPDDVCEPTNEDFLEPCHGYNEEAMALASHRDQTTPNPHSGTHRLTPRGERIRALLDTRHGYRLMRSTHLIEFLKYHFSEDLSEQTTTRYLRWLTTDEKELLRITRDPDANSVTQGSLAKIYGLHNEANVGLNERQDKPSFVIPHALDVASTMAFGVVRACRESQGAMRFIDAPDILQSWGTVQAKAAAKPYTWPVQVVYRGETHKCNITPDRLFAIYFTALEHRWCFVLEEDRSTEPHERDDYAFNAGTSLFRKFLTYCFAYHMQVPKKLYKINGFRILFVTDSQTRIKHALEIWKLANETLQAFQKQSNLEIRAVPKNVLHCAERSALRASDMFTVPWRNGRDEEVFITPPVAAPQLSAVG